MRDEISSRLPPPECGRETLVPGYPWEKVSRSRHQNIIYMILEPSPSPRRLPGVQNVKLDQVRESPLRGGDCTALGAPHSPFLPETLRRGFRRGTAEWASALVEADYRLHPNKPTHKQPNKSNTTRAQQNRILDAFGINGAACLGRMGHCSAFLPIVALRVGEDGALLLSLPRDSSSNRTWSFRGP